MTLKWERQQPGWYRAQGRFGSSYDIFVEVVFDVPELRHTVCFNAPDIGRYGAIHCLGVSKHFCNVKAIAQQHADQQNHQSATKEN